ncbi:hypothetical protein EVAR_97513_1 [Eumeta japonica]|uniref:Uncharacterized protein n=1 Tax=Eumeta variegata TaxID=151549 RepID=A0A4C1WLZ0_EUMVA|nr:hypothetical protein EVAR_97513_1 [Eumeta japonica]
MRSEPQSVREISIYVYKCDKLEYQYGISQTQQKCISYTRTSRPKLKFQRVFYKPAGRAAPIATVGQDNALSGRRRARRTAAGVGVCVRRYHSFLGLRVQVFEYGNYHSAELMGEAIALLNGQELSDNTERGAWLLVRTRAGDTEGGSAIQAIVNQGPSASRRLITRLCNLKELNSLLFCPGIANAFPDSLSAIVNDNYGRRPRTEPAIMIYLH